MGMELDEPEKICFLEKNTDVLNEPDSEKGMSSLDPNMSDIDGNYDEEDEENDDYDEEED